MPPPEPSKQTQRDLALKLASGVQGILSTGADVSVLTITEMTGLKRSIELRGPALPFRGAEWAASMRLITTWYAGNGVEASQQVLGTVELPSSWEGMWRRTQMGRTPSLYTTENGGSFKITTPAAMREIFEGEGGIFRSGARLRVMWGVQIVAKGRSTLASMTREGRCKEWHWPHDTAHDIGWKMDWEWVGRGVRQQNVVATRDGNLSAGASALALSMNDYVNFAELNPIQTTNRKIAHGPSNFTLGQLEALTQVPNALLTGLTRSFRQSLNQLKQIADIVNKVRNIPSQLANTAIAEARNTIAIANNFVDKMSRRSPETNSAKAGFTDLVRAAGYFGGSTLKASQVARNATELAIQLRKAQSASPGSGGLSNSTTSGSSSNTILAVHVVKETQTIAWISNHYYGSVDHAVDICRANRLPWNQSSTQRGTVLIIPRLKDGQGTS